MSTQDTTLPPLPEKSPFDLEGMRRLATLISPFAGEAVLQCCDEIARLKALVAIAAQAQPPEYEALEREHLGDAEKGTGIYHPDNRQAQQAQGVPAGMALVPLEATPEMTHAGRYGGDKDAPPFGAKPIEGETAWPFCSEQTAQKIYRAMLAAAPQAEPQTPAPAHHAELDYDAWECPDCGGAGRRTVYHSVTHQLGTDDLPFWEACETCDGTGYCGPDAEKLAALSKPPAQHTVEPQPEREPIPDGEKVIDALRAAMDKASVPHDFRASLIGYFCNGWNEIIRRAAPQAEPQPELSWLPSGNVLARCPDCVQYDPDAVCRECRVFVPRSSLAKPQSGIGSNGGANG